MPERDGYIPGVPCWVDTSQPDPEQAVAFYGALFGWECEDVMPPGSGLQYFMARIRGGDVAAIGSLPAGQPQTVTWKTYLWVDDADATAAKVRDAGGSVLIDPFDLMDAGRKAVFTDPEGAEFSVWQAKASKGSQIVNEHGSVNFNVLNTRDLDGAKVFYGAVFGWQTLELGGPGLMWTLPGYGDHLEVNDPDIRERVAEVGGPKGFEDVVASALPLGDESVSAHWSVTFGVDDADAIAARASELGGRVLAGPFDAPWVRATVIADPQGATFTASQFVLENKDLPTSA